MEFLKDFFNFLLARKKWWLVPVIFILFLIGGLIIFGSGSAISPFIYSIF